MQHTLSVVRLCEFYCQAYPKLNRDLLVSAAICHDMGKVKELSLFPQNDYTEEGQFLGHIVIGTEMVSERIRKIPGFPVLLASELKHCILAHHGEYELVPPKTCDHGGTGAEFCGQHRRKIGNFYGAFG